MHNLRKRAHAVANAGEEESDDEAAFLKGSERAGTLDEAVPSDSNGDGSGHRGDLSTTPSGKPDSSRNDAVDEVGTKGTKKRRTGGLRVEYLHLGPEEERSHYHPDQSIIIINLDHSMVAAALKLDGNEASTEFRRRSPSVPGQVQ